MLPIGKKEHAKDYSSELYAQIMLHNTLLIKNQKGLLK